MIWSFEIPGKLPTLNEYVQQERSNRYKAAKLKRETQELIMAAIPPDHPHFHGHVFIYFGWIRPDARADKDNVAFAKKFILDALQDATVIKRDSWKLATPYDQAFMVNRSNPRTVVTISTERID